MPSIDLLAKTELQALKPQEFLRLENRQFAKYIERLSVAGR